MCLHSHSEFEHDCSAACACGPGRLVLSACQLAACATLGFSVSRTANLNMTAGQRVRVNFAIWCFVHVGCLHVALTGFQSPVHAGWLHKTLSDFQSVAWQI